MKIVIINGAAESGKDTFVNLVRHVGIDKGKLVNLISTIDPIKDIYRKLGWDGEKTEKHREVLRYLKQLWIENSEGFGPLGWICQKVEKCKNHVDLMFIMIREADQIKDTYNSLVDMGYETYLLNVVRPGIEIIPMELKCIESCCDIKYDFEIINNTAKEGENFQVELLQKAKDFWKQIKKGKKEMNENNVSESKMTLQELLFDWQCKNFPQEDLENLSKEELIKMVKILQMTLGVCEEAGEVAHAVLKGTQKIREGRNGIDKNLVADGFGDIYVFGNQLLSFLEVKVQDALHETIKTVFKRDWKVNPHNGEE